MFVSVSRFRTHVVIESVVTLRDGVSLWHQVNYMKETRTDSLITTETFAGKWEELACEKP